MILVDRYKNHHGDLVLLHDTKNGLFYIGAGDYDATDLGKILELDELCLVETATQRWGEAMAWFDSGEAIALCDAIVAQRATADRRAYDMLLDRIVDSYQDYIVQNRLEEERRASRKALEEVSYYGMF